ncbi:MAG TPA: response regulator [Blastococcus sp.]|jgi:DNA-binding NarL/FixJ family response regulator
MYVIFVDDTEADRLLVRECVERSALQHVETYNSSEELSDVVQQILRGAKPRPALVILDMQIGDDDECGLEMLQNIRITLPEVPAIMLSHSARRQIVEESYRRGASSYIPKDVDQVRFGERLDAMTKYWSGVSRLPAGS